VNDINDLREAIKQRKTDQGEPRSEVLRIAFFASLTLGVLVLVTMLIA
jgi:hypothetical protein